MKVWRYRTVAALLTFSIIGTNGVAQSGDSGRVVEGSKVTVAFTVSLPDKTVVATTEGQEPLAYIQGQGQIAPGVEKAMVGLKAGDKKHLELKAEDAYGAYDDKKRFSVSKDRIPPDAKVGSVLQDRMGQPVKVVELSDKEAVLDSNHPLAGKTVMFDVKVIKVEAPGATLP